MIETNSLAMAAESVDGFTGTEVELDAVFWRHQKKRLIKMRKTAKSVKTGGGFAISLAAPIRIFRNDQTAVNEAAVLLLPNELANFTRAIIQHPILLPISFSQNLMLERGISILRLTTREPFEDFAERLSAALRVLE